MRTQPITCPDTAHLEELELEDTPDGVLVISCSRLARERETSCARDCARRLDRRTHAHDVRAERILIVIDEDAATLRIARHVAIRLANDQLHVEVAGCTPTTPAPDDYAVVVLGGVERAGGFALGLVDYARRHRDVLARKPVILFAAHSGRDDLAARFAALAGFTPQTANALDLHALASQIADAIEPPRSLVG